MKNIKSLSDAAIAASILPIVGLAFIPIIGPILAAIYWVVWLYAFVGIIILSMELRRFLTGSYV